MLAPFRTSSKKEFKRIPICQIAKNPNQPRKVFDEQALLELSDSIRQYGVITPLTVRQTATGYELIAGERRLRASRMAGLSAVPCYIMEAEELDSSLMALVENLQRRDLDYFDEALGLQRLTTRYHMTQQQAAAKVGKTQPAVANKLRLLKLDPATVEIARSRGLTERHARALLRIEEPEMQASLAAYIADNGLNVEQTERLIEKRLQQEQKGKKAAKRKIVLKDMRFFLNTINHAVSTMKLAGIPAKVDRREVEDGLLVTIKIPNTSASR